MNTETQRCTDELIQKNLGLVKQLARHLMCRLPPVVQLDDLIQAGMVGLIEAAHHYQGEKGAAFATYASIRVKGSILDEIRRQDWVPRSVYKMSREISAAVKNVENRLGRDAHDHEVAEELKVSLEDYYTMLQDAQAAHLYGFDDLGIDDDHLFEVSHPPMGEPFRDVMQQDYQHYLANIIQLLPKNEQMAISLYYEHELQLKEIGDILEVSESRVSQILSQATHRIRARLENSFES
jgi:RNA polymerase sigma factor for flagellar operon FliA